MDMFHQSRSGLQILSIFIGMKWACLIMGLLLYSCWIKAQSYFNNPGKLSVHVSPLLLIDENPRYRLGIDYSLDADWKLSLETGMGNDHINHMMVKGSRWENKFNIVEFRTEVKRQLLRADPHCGYLALEFFHQQAKARFENGYFLTVRHSPTFFDQVDYMNRKTGINIKGGAAIMLNKKCFIDFYAGLGLAFRHIRYTNLENPVYQHYELFKYPFINKFFRYQGRRFRPQLPVGFRLGFHLY